MHPLGEVVVVLPVPVPLQTLVKRFFGAALGEGLPDPQSPAGRVQGAFAAAQAADPAGPMVIASVTAEDAMHLIDEVRRESPEALLSRPAKQFQEVADGKRIGPEITARRILCGGNPRRIGEAEHESPGCCQRGGLRRGHRPFRSLR